MTPDNPQIPNEIVPPSENPLVKDQVQPRSAADVAQNTAISDMMTGKNASIDKLGLPGAKDILDPSTMSRKDIVDQIAANDKAIASLSKNIPDIQNQMAAVEKAMKLQEEQRKIQGTQGTALA